MSTRGIVYAGAALVGVSTAATSAVTLYRLAQLCGIGGPLAAALPIALDAGAAVAALVWITEKGELQRWGRWIAISTLLASLVGNGIQHAVTSGLLAVTLPLVLIVGACIPACLWATVHMAALMVRPERTTRPVAKPKPDRRTDESAAGAPQPGPTAEPVSPDELAAVRRARAAEKKRRQRAAAKARTAEA